MQLHGMIFANFPIEKGDVLWNFASSPRSVHRYHRVQIALGPQMGIHDSSDLEKYRI